MKYLHTMVRVSDLESSLQFYCQALGLTEVSRKDSEAGRFTLVFLTSAADSMTADIDSAPMIELTYNWDDERYTEGRNFGHLAYSVENIYQSCERLMANGVIINRPPRDGRMAFVRSPDNISIELLQQGTALPLVEPWASMGNIGEW
ncbi:MAG: VOC family protein [Porticoccaceae bacterium]|jgi:lactoylglutathione lyase|tara:strand:+ start:168 stop:608 length:441 start_codon:yes stop_codon:yes gene_type:complete